MITTSDGETEASVMPEPYAMAEPADKVSTGARSGGGEVVIGAVAPDALGDRAAQGFTSLGDALESDATGLVVELPLWGVGDEAELLGGHVQEYEEGV